ncbi:histone-like nucleoid-structuring protein Lsr2 [Nocardioides abyssi]|uniref:Lsr2 family protein n=1 Tax=Nocardioides abyssi TaxID=3058370 RepID=A0ABT8EYP3_9ACTN|nr:Lsr2 family protein [Nocardioides abyssi]MDN4162951.1 Lsr2 family protein [Nocardioides abyssi]
MAQKQHVVYESDLSGKAIEDNDAPTVSFGWDGKDYEIDLTSKEAEDFYKVMEKYLSVARKVTGKAKSTKSASKGKSNAAEVRAWAESNGIEVPARGRIPQSVIDQFESASA